MEVILLDIMALVSMAVVDAITDVDVTTDVAITTLLFDFIKEGG